MPNQATYYPRINVRLRFEERRLLERISDHAQGSLSQALRAGLRLIESQRPNAPIAFECPLRPKGPNAQTLCGFMISDHDEVLIGDMLALWKTRGVRNATVTNLARTAIALLARELPDLARGAEHDALSQRAQELEAELAIVNQQLAQFTVQAERESHDDHLASVGVIA